MSHRTIPAKTGPVRRFATHDDADRFHGAGLISRVHTFFLRESTTEHVIAWTSEHPRLADAIYASADTPQQWCQTPR